MTFAHRLLSLGLLLALCLSAGAVRADPFPSRPIRIVVPFAPGGSSEIVARSVAAEMSKTLVYERTGEDDKYLPLIMSPENARAAVGDSSQAPFVVANSMREVQPDINILVSPVPERLFARKPEGVPDWVLPVVEES